MLQTHKKLLKPVNLAIKMKQTLKDVILPKMHCLQQFWIVVRILLLK